jgi:hypothetical protein
VTRRLGANALVLAGYAAVAFAYFGARLASHPGRDLLGHGRDPQIFVWSFAWWPHAVETWQNPFYSHAIYAPDGINLVWATTVPGLALLFAPLTALVGPAASFNVAEMLMPALSAWTAYLLCRHLTRSLWPALVGGYLYGFSSYMLGQEQGHMHMTAIFLLPLMALAVVRYLRAEIDGRGVAWRLGLLFGLQFWLSTEVLLTASLALAVSLVLAYWLLPRTRPRLRALLPPLAAAIGLAVVVSAPLVYYAVTGFQSEPISAVPADIDGDLVNFLLPTHFTWVGGSTFEHISRSFRGNDSEQGSYLGIPTLVIIGWFALGARRSSAVRYLLTALALTALLTLGTGIAVKGKIEVGLPWKYVAEVPPFNNVLPGRFALFGSLIAAVIVALWAATRRGWARWLLPALAVLAIVPDLTHAFWQVHPERWEFFTSKTYKICFPRDQNVAVFPFGGWDASTLWQAESGFYFRMPGGYLAPTPPAKNLASDPVIQMLTYTLANPNPDEIIAFARNKKVDRIISVAIYVHPSGSEMRQFGQVQESGGVLISPACSYPSMQKGIHPAAPPGG